MDVRTRVAPSPTGDPHVGTAYMALFNFIFAHHHQGSFVLRIEDTDQERSRPLYEEKILSALKWLDIHWDEGPDVGGSYGPYRQSEKVEVYRNYCQQLLERGWAYKCFATPQELQEMRCHKSTVGTKLGYDKQYRHLTPEEVKEKEKMGLSYTIRLKVPLQGVCKYEDLIKGKISIPWNEVDDQILMKSDGFPTYHLANVVDDHEMKISHVIRGDEWLYSTPKHLLLYEAFGWTPPQFLHMPLLLGTDGKKLSKRKNPVSIFYYKESGYLPKALSNFLTLTSYTMPDHREIYPLEEIVNTFSIRGISPSNAIFDVRKLDWMNQHYLIHSIQPGELWTALKEWGFSEEKMNRIMPLAHTRIKTFGEFMEWCGFLFINHIEYQLPLLCPEGISPERGACLLLAMIWSMEEQQDWGSQGFERASHEVAETFQVHHKKVVMRLLFAAITGKPQGLPLFRSVEILGQERTRARILQAIAFLGNLSNARQQKLRKVWQEQRPTTHKKS